MRQKICTACGGKMQDLGPMRLQRGAYGLLTGALSQLIDGALDVDVEVCVVCRKMEFYLHENESAAGRDEIAQIACPVCGRPHDMDDVFCPHCGARLMTLE